MKREKDKIITAPETLHPELSTILMEYLGNMLKLDTQNLQVMSLKPELKADVHTFLQFFPKNCGKNNSRKNIGYEALPDYLQTTSLTLEDLFSLLGVKLKPYPEDIQMLIKFTSSLSMYEKRLFLDTLEPLIARRFIDKSIDNVRPSYRIVMFYEYLYSKKEITLDAFKDQPKIVNAIQDRWFCTKVPITDFPDFARKTHCSLHWLLKAFPCVYTNDSISDRIIDYYGFLPREYQIAFLESIKR